MLKHLFLPLVFPVHYESDPLVLNSLFPGTGSMPWLLTIYPGMMILPLALFGLVFCFSRRMFFWGLLFIMSLLLALGHQTPLYALFYKALPVFRFPEKFMFLASFALQAMAAFGLERLLRIFRNRRWKLNLIFCLALFTLAADLFYSNRHLNPIFDARLYAAYDRNLEPILKDRESFRVYVDPEMALLSSGPSSILKRHQQWQNYLMPNLGILRHVSQVDGVTGLELKYQYILTELLMKPWPERIRLLRLLNVKYIVSPLQLERNSELVDQVLRINRFVYQLKGHLPRAWIVGNLAPIEKGIAEELIDPSFDPLHTALARRPISEKPSEPFHQPVHSVYYAMSGRIHIEVTARQHGFLVLSESSYPGWQVILDGEEQDPMWLNLLFQGVEIGPGKHQIDFIFRPKGFEVFALVSAVSLFLFLVGVVVTILRTKSRGCLVKG